MEVAHNKQWLVYSAVARDNVVVADYSPLGITAASSFAELATCFLSDLHGHTPPVDHSHFDTTNIISFTRDHHTFHFLTQDNFNFMVVSNDSNRKHIVLEFLQGIKAEFYRWYGDVTKTATNFEAHKDFGNFEAHKDFGSTLKEHMHYCVEYSHKLVRFASMKDQVHEAKEIAIENIQRVHDVHVESPMINTESHMINTETLNIHVENFHKQGKQLKRQMWIHQTKVRVVATLISFVMIFSIWLLVCRGFKC